MCGRAVPTLLETSFEKSYGKHVDSYSKHMVLATTIYLR